MSEVKTHYARTELSDHTYQVYLHGELILQSEQAVKLEEFYDGKTYPPVIYFPPTTFAALETSRSGKTTHCPIKGDASYWSFRDIENCIWCYENPVPEMSQIENHFAFDQSLGFHVAQAF